MSINLSATNLVLAALLAVAAAYCIFAAIRTHLPWRKWRVAAMLACRLAMLTAVAAWALEARVQYPSRHKDVELVVLADRSPSLSQQGRATVDRWISRAQDGLKGRGRLHVVEFGNGSTSSSPPGGSTGSSPPGGWTAGAPSGGEGSPISEMLDQARCRFTGKCERRILLVSDGRATTADPMAIAARLAADKIPIFTVPAEALAGESLVADVSAPAAAWRGVPTPVDVTLIAPCAETCKLTMRIDGEVKAARDLNLPAGLSNVEFSATFEKDGVHQIDFKAVFAHDVLDWNNSASALVDVPLAPRVIVLADPVETAVPLATALTAGGMTVRVVKPSELPTQFSCDCIVLGNVPADALGDARQKALEKYVRDGGAIVFCGGVKSFGAGGYAATPLENVFPVMLTPDKEHPPYALAIVLDNSWSMNEAVTSNVGKINLAKEIAIAAIDGLSKGDVLTLVSFDSDFHDIIPVTKVADLKPLEYEVSRIGAFGMTNILGGLTEAYHRLPGIDAAYKHLVLISDGNETEQGTDYGRLLSLLNRDNITLSTIAVGSNADQKLMNTLAFAGKGRFYHIKDLKEIPNIVLKEARNMQDQLVTVAAMPLTKLADDPALAGLDVSTFPSVLGFNRTRARTHAWTPLAIGPKKEPLLARMRYGRGQSLAFTSSAGSIWVKDWIEKKPAEYATFWRQAVASVLNRPYRQAAPVVQYDNGLPVLGLAFGPQDKVEVTRLVGGSTASSPPRGKLHTAPAGPNEKIATGGCDAVLATAKGKSNAAFNWSFSTNAFGKEFGDVAKGRELLKDLAGATGGVFDPSEAQVLAPSNATVVGEITPAMFLALAVLLLTAELLLRRLPAVKSLLRRKQ
jgi:uncharacterized membrane protein